MKKKITTTPEEVASYVSWVLNAFIMKLECSCGLKVSLDAKRSEKFRKEIIDEVSLGALRYAIPDYKEQLEILRSADLQAVNEANLVKHEAVE